MNCLPPGCKPQRTTPSRRRRSAEEEYKCTGTTLLFILLLLLLPLLCSSTYSAISVVSTTSSAATHRPDKTQPQPRPTEEQFDFVLLGARVSTDEMKAAPCSAITDCRRILTFNLAFNFGAQPEQSQRKGAWVGSGKYFSLCHSHSSSIIHP